MKRKLTDRLADLCRALRNLEQRLLLDTEAHEDALEDWAARTLDLDPSNPKEREIITRASRAFSSEEYGDMIGEATIKCFEICYDLFWHAVRQFLLEVEHESKESTPPSPHKVFKRAYELKIVNEQQEQLLLSMHEDRGNTVHTYIPGTVREIISRTPRYRELMQVLYERMNERIEHADENG